MLYGFIPRKEKQGNTYDNTVESLPWGDDLAASSIWMAMANCRQNIESFCSAIPSGLWGVGHGCHSGRTLTVDKSETISN